MPPRAILGDQITYQSEAVFYNFSCQWLAPTFLLSEGTANDSDPRYDWTVSFGSDMTGCLDEILVDKADGVRFGQSHRLLNPDAHLMYFLLLLGAYPLILTSGLGSENGSFAWLINGGDSSSVTLDLSSIPASRKTSNSALMSSKSANYTSTVLYCDPHMELGIVDVKLQDQMLSAERIEDTANITKIDSNEASRMLGSSLNELALNNDFTNLTFFSPLGDDMSRLAFELVFLTSVENATAAAIPQELGNISASLNWYTSIVGSNVYLDGTLGNTSVNTMEYREARRLEWSINNLWITASLTFLTAALILVLTMHERERRLAVAFSVATALSIFQSASYSAIHTPALLSHRARISRVLIFTGFEISWLVLAVITHFHLISISSSTPSSKLSKVGLSAVGIVWQLVALIPVFGIITETFSSEWAYNFALLKEKSARGSSDKLGLYQHVDHMSTLTSGFLDRTKHILSLRASRRFVVAFTLSLLSIVLKAVAPGAISTGADIVSSNVELLIGSIPASATFDPEAQLKATRFSYLSMVENTDLSYVRLNYLFFLNLRSLLSTNAQDLTTNNTLFGLPPRSMLSSQLSYRTRAVYFNFECQWAAPKYIPVDDILTDLSETKWEIETRSGAIQVQPILFIGGTLFILQMI